MLQRFYFAWVESGARTHDTRNHNPMLCQLSYDHHTRRGLDAHKRMLFFQKRQGRFFLGTSAFDQKAGAKVLLFFEIRKYFALFLQKIFIYAKNVVPLRRIL